MFCVYYLTDLPFFKGFDLYFYLMILMANVMVGKRLFMYITENINTID